MSSNVLVPDLDNPEGNCLFFCSMSFLNVNSWYFMTGMVSILFVCFFFFRQDHFMHLKLKKKVNQIIVK